MNRALLPSLVLVNSLITGFGTQWYDGTEANYEQVPYIPIKTMNVCEFNNLRQTSRYLLTCCRVTRRGATRVWATSARSLSMRWLGTAAPALTTTLPSCSSCCSNTSLVTTEGVRRLKWPHLSSLKWLLWVTGWRRRCVSTFPKSSKWIHLSPDL